MRAYCGWVNPPARRLSLVTGAVESAVGLFDLRILAGHAPGFARLLKGMEPGLKKWTLTTGMSVASANIAQGTGDLATRFIEGLGTTGEVNPERFKPIVGDWAKERPAVFFQLLPAALVGGGIANFRDFKDGGRFLLAPSFLKVVGFSPKQQARLVAARTPEEAQAIYREEFSQRTPENIAEGLDELHATLDQVESVKNNPADSGEQPGLDELTPETRSEKEDAEMHQAARDEEPIGEIKIDEPSDWSKAFGKSARVIRKGEGVKAVLGRELSDEELTRLAGATSDSVVNVTGSIFGTPALTLEVKSRYVKDQIRALHRDENGQLVLQNLVFEGANGNVRGFGAHSLATQVQIARQLGVHRIEAFAYREPNSKRWVGYYVWARLGFDAKLTPEEIEALPGWLSNSKSIRDIFKTEKGRRWWEEWGYPKDMQFFLKENSPSMRVLKKYIEDNHYNIHL